MRKSAKKDASQDEKPAKKNLFGQKGVRLGGRQKGTRNKSTIERESRVKEMAERLAVREFSPLEVMLLAMENEMRRQQKLPEEKQNWPLVADLASKAAPYIHARLAHVAVTQEPNPYANLSREQVAAEMARLSQELARPPQIEGRVEDVVESEEGEG